MADAVVTNAATTTTLNNVMVTGNLVVNAANSLIVKGDVIGVGTDGIDASSRLTTLELNFGQSGLGGVFTANGTVTEGTSTIGDDRVAIVVVGGSGADTFNLNSAGNISTINGAVESNKGINFNGMGGDDVFNISSSVAGGLNGGTGADRFNINAAGLNVFAIDGGGDADTLRGWNETSLWKLATTNGGELVTSVDGVGAPVTKISFSNVKNLTGGSSDDTFTLDTNGAIDGMVDGGLGNNTLKARVTGANSWLINGSGSSVSYVNSFRNLQTLNGGGGVDTFAINSDFGGVINGLGGDDIFNLASSVNGTLNGGAGADSFNLNALGLSVTAINGDGDSDTLRGANELSLWQINAANGGNVNAKVYFSNIENLTGGSGNDTFTLAAAGEVTGAIDGGLGINTLKARTAGDNSWTIAASGNSVSYVNRFTNLQTLNGGADVDTFAINTDFGGVINGLGGDDIFNLTYSVSGTLNGDAGANSFNLNAVDLAIAAINGGGDLDTLRGANELSLWQITTGNGGALITSGSVATPLSQVLFSGIENLSGGSSDDTFTLDTNGAVTGMIDGGLGDNTLNARASGYNNWSITAGGNSVSHVTSFRNLQTLNGGAGVDTFNLASDFGGVINGLGGDDVFNITASVSGALNGGAGSDLFNLNALGLSVTAINGGEGVDTDILRGANEKNEWRITAANSGSLNTAGTVIFSDIETLVGGSGDDAFTLDVGGSLSGLINGATGSDSLEILAGNAVVQIGGVINGNINVDNLESITANAASINTLIGDDAQNGWAIDGGRGGAVVRTVGAVVTTTRFNNFDTVSGGSNQDIFNISANFAGTLNGQGGSDIFNLTSSIGGTLNGGAGADIFNIDAVDLSVAAIDGGGDIDTLRGANELSLWQISAINGGNVNAKVYFSNIENLTGGSGNDTFTLDVAGELLGVLDGGLGNNTLNARITGANSWLINGSGSSVSYVNSFRNLQTLNGGGGVDTFAINTDFGGAIDGLGGDDIFNLASSVSGTLNGGAGMDSFNLNAPNLNIAAINGGVDVDTLNGANELSLWQISATNGGDVNSKAYFSNIENLIGGSGNDTFTLDVAGELLGVLGGGGGFNTLNARTAGDNNWTIAASGNSVSYVTRFTNLQTLNGGAGVDTFGIATNFAGAINGLGGDDVFNLTASVSGTLNGGIGADSFNLNAVDLSITAINGGGDSNTLRGANELSLWQISAANGGNVNAKTYFSNIENLIGGSGNDTFTLDAAGVIDGVIDGGLGNNTLNARNSGINTWTIAAAGNAVSHVNQFRNLNTLNGGAGVDIFNIATGFGGVVNGLGGDDIFNLSSSVAGTLNGGAGSDRFNLNGLALTVAGISGGDTAGDTDILQGANEDTLWSITSANSGTLANGKVAFNGIEKFVGGSGDDVFSLANGVSLTGLLIDGGAHVAGDSVDMSALSGPLNIKLGSSGIAHIERVVGNNDKNTLLVGEDNINSWLITAPGAGVIDEGTPEQLTFSGMTNLLGGTSDDSFRFKSADGNSFDFLGRIDGGDGAGSDKIDYSNQDNVRVTVSSALDAINGSSISGIEGVIGGVNSTLVGVNANSDWTIDGTNKGSVKYTSTGKNSTLTTLDFEGFSNLLGGTANDTFLFSSGGSVSGWIDGGVGNDSVNMAALNKVDVVLGGNLLNIEKITGNYSDSTLRGENRSNTWTLTGENDGNVNGVTFIDFSNLVGGNADDSFVFNSQGRLSGLIDGGGQATLDSVNMAALANVNVVLGRDVVNVGMITGNNFASTLTGENNANKWTLTGTNAGNVDGVNFVGFNNLVGGSADDNFVFNALSALSGRIDGGGQTSQDSVNMAALATVNVLLGRDVVNIEQITGNNVNSTLVGENNNNIWNITGTNSGAVDGVAFTSVNNLVGGNADDNFVFSGQGRLTGRIDGGLHQTQDSVNMAALATVNVVLGKDVVNIEQIMGNDSASTLTGENNNNTWTLTGENDGNVDGVAFINFNNLVGGSGDDSFDFNFGSSLSGRIDGGTHIVGDTVSMAALATVNTVLGKDLLNVEQITGNSSASTLTGENNPNTWTLTGENVGVVDGVTFINFNNLVGGNADDYFVFNTLGRLTGKIDGGLHLIQDSINMAALTTVDVVLGEHVINIEQITGNNTNSTLTGENIANAWTLTGKNIGSVNGVKFVDFNKLVGGSGDDRFVFNSGSSLTGLLDGGDHIVRDSVDMSALAVVDVSLSSDMRNVELITGNNTNSRLTGSNKTNTWTITDVNDGKINDVSFVDFNHLVGGDLDDSFIFGRNGAVTGSIDGGGHVGGDSIDMSALDVVDVVMGKQIVNVEAITGNNIASILTGTDAINTWTINGVNAGQLNTNGASLSFSGFNNLVGGKLKDQFNIVNGGMLNGSIMAGAGDDLLTVSLMGSQNGRLRFNGGEGSDAIQLSGGSSSYVEMYQTTDFDGEFSFLNNGNDYVVSLSDVESIQDDVIAILSVYGTAANDAIVLDAGKFSVNAASSVRYSNKNNIAFDGAAGEADVISLEGNVTASGLVSLAAESVVNSTANVITADGLALKGVSSAGLPANRIRTDVKNMYLANSGGLYLENKGDVNIAQMDANGVVDIVAGGNVSSIEKLSSEAAFNVVSDGNIDFSNTGNLLNGPISFEATTGAITLKNASNVNFSKVDAKKLTVAATGNIVSSGNVNVTGDSRISASGDILITGSNDFSTVDLSANNIVLHDNNTVDLTNVVALTGAEINAGNGVGIGPRIQLVSATHRSR